MRKISRVGRINGLHMTCVSHVFLVRSRQSRFPFRWTRVTWVTKSLCFGTTDHRLPHCFLLDISLISPLMWFFLHFTSGPQSAVRSPQSAVRSLRFTLTDFKRLSGMEAPAINSRYFCFSWPMVALRHGLHTFEKKSMVLKDRNLTPLLQTSL